MKLVWEITFTAKVLKIILPTGDKISLVSIWESKLTGKIAYFVQPRYNLLEKEIESIVQHNGIFDTMSQAEKAIEEILYNERTI